MLLTIILVCIYISAMYVCVCNAVTENQIREAVKAGARNLGDLRLATGCATNCGQCTPLAVALLEHATERPSNGLFLAQTSPA